MPLIKETNYNLLTKQTSKFNRRRTEPYRNSKQYITILNDNLDQINWVGFI